MHPPSAGKALPFPVHLKPYIVAQFEGNREDLRTALGEPHFIETDSARTFGGDEDNWAWELPSGLRFLLTLRVPYKEVVICSDPPVVKPIVDALDLDPTSLFVHEQPILDPSYCGPI